MFSIEGIDVLLEGNLCAKTLPLLIVGVLLVQYGGRDQQSRVVGAPCKYVHAGAHRVGRWKPATLCMHTLRNCAAIWFCNHKPVLTIRKLRPVLLYWPITETPAQHTPNSPARDLFSTLF